MSTGSLLDFGARELKTRTFVLSAQGDDADRQLHRAVLQLAAIIPTPIAEPRSSTSRRDIAMIDFSTRSDAELYQS
jgi:hypothetical protein